MAFCNQCGAALSDGARFCPACGAERPAQAPASQYQSAYTEKTEQEASQQQQGPTSQYQSAYTEKTEQEASQQQSAYTEPRQPAYAQPAYSQPGYGQPPRQDGEQSAPVMSVGSYLGTLLLLCIPVANIVLLFVWAFGSEGNPNRRNFARANLILVLIGVVLSILIVAAVGSSLTALLGGIRNFYY